MAETEVGYFVPRTFVEVSGTVSFAYDWAHGAVQKTSEATVELGVERDPKHWYRYKGDGSFLANREMSFEWAADGRLTSAAVKSTGMAGVVLKGIATLAATALMLAREEPEHPCKRLGEAEKTPWEQFKDANQELAARKEAADAASSEISRKIVDAVANPGADPEPEKALVLKLSRLRRIQGYLEQESAAVNQVFEAWKAAEEKKRIAKWLGVPDFGQPPLAAGGPATYRLCVEDLPSAEKFEVAAQRPSAVSWEEFEDAGGKESAWTVAKDLLTVVARSEMTDPKKPVTGKTAEGYRRDNEGKVIEGYDGVVYRIGRPVTFAIYEISGGINPTNDQFVICTAERKAVINQTVVNEESAAGLVKFERSFFAEHSGEISIGEEGSIAKLGSAKGSEFAAAVGAFGEVPGHVADAFTKANEIIDQQQVRDLQAIDHRVAELTKQKELLEAEIVQNAQSRWQIRERARLQAAIDHLTAVKAFGDAKSALLQAPPADPAPSTLEELLATGDVSSVEIKLPDS